MIPRRLPLNPVRAQSLASRAFNRQYRLLHLSGLSSSFTRDARPVEVADLGKYSLGQSSPRQTSAGRSSPATQRWKTTATGNQKSGHIKAGPNESIIFFDNLFPLKLRYGWLSYLIGRPWGTDEDLTGLLQKFDNSALGIANPINLVKRSIPDDPTLKVTEIIPRLKDGGAFVKFSHPADTTAQQIEERIANYLLEKPIKPWFNPFRSIQVGLVRGVPWLEDLEANYPKNRIRIEFVPKEPGAEAVELSQETLFSIFRKYGKIEDIMPQPSDSKTIPKYAHIDFAFVRNAVMAKNCLHGIIVSERTGGGKTGTKLRLSYERIVKGYRIWDWMSNHPRIVIPIVAALLAAITVIIFDPIREFFIKAHIQKRFSLSDNKIFQWFKRQTNDILAFRRHKAEEAGMTALFTHRRDAIEQIQKWLLESADTFIVVQGPRGSGKEELVLDQALGGRKDVLLIDCKPIVEARGESGTIKNLASEVGYRPVFSWANQVSSLIDLAVQSTTGVKSGFSETLDSQINKILHNTATALKKVSLESRDKDDEDHKLNDDAYLEAHPERRAVVVFDNFLLKNEETSIIYDKLSEWAAALVQANIAHVVFMTSDASYSKSLSKSLPDRVFRSIALGDLSPEVAKKYVMGRLTQTNPKNKSSEEVEKEKKNALEIENRRDLKELDEVIDVVGGRLTDLEFLARRMKSGQSPKEAITDIVDQSASEILKLFLLPNKGQRKYSTEQAWYLIKEIAQKESLRYNEVLLSNTFASSTSAGVENGDVALEALTNAELITVKSHRGRPQVIQAGKPVYFAAFNALLHDPVLKAKMDLAVLTELSKVETKVIDKVESELSLLGSLPRQPWETTERINYLLGKLHISQSRILGYEKEIVSLKKVLTRET
ncbi:mitochondrial escape protein 2 [Cytospora paraplurivora]|uniref:Mitochondrial escape protein 2 n=1 Tax=Cytospora paraplurivora TaxID=2898453 RepID=A0AAN9UEM5_9PEZI